MKRILLHVPHSSTRIPFTEGYRVDNELLEQEMLKLTDWFTDDIFYSEEDIVIRADFSRIFCDVERFADDEQEVMAQFGMGVLYEKMDDGELMRDVNPELKQKILNGYYWPHHKALSNAVNEQLLLYGRSLILDCHSFPDIPLNRALDKNPERPDFNIGTDPYHTPQVLIGISADFFEKAGYSLGIDWPYQGSVVPLEHYQKNKNVHTIMLEINRRLYLNGTSNEKSKDYNHIKSLVSAFIKEIKC